MVYERARHEANEGIRAELVHRANTLAGLVEVDLVGYELEVPLQAMPEYDADGERAYFAVHDWEGDEFLISPSLGEERLPPPSAWDEDGSMHHEDLEAGPGGRPCAMVTHCFLVRVEVPDEDDEHPPLEIPEEELRFKVQVALDTTDRDQRLAALAWFLVITGGASTLVALLGGAYLARRLMRPVRDMTETARAMTPDDPTRRLEPERVVTELDSLATTLNSAFDRLERALSQQKRFIADASHELRTPASVLLSNAELLLRRERTAEEYRAGLERQAGAAKRMAVLIEDLLTLARADAGRAELDRARLDLSGVADAVCREHAALAEQGGIALRCAAEPGVEVEGDPQRLGQLVSNLVSNALKFVPRGGHVDVSVTSSGSGASLTVVDDGPGISPEHHERVFERFYRVDEQRSGRQNGTGLGLAIAAWVAEVHGGRIGVESRPGEGATFRVSLPRAAG